MRIKFFILILGMALLPLTGCNKTQSAKGSTIVSEKEKEKEYNGTSQADYPFYEDLKSITEKSTDIITGTLLKDKGEREIKVTSTWSSDDDIMVPYHIYLIKVKEVLKGNLETGKEIEIRVPISEDSPSITEEGVYFLSLFEDFNPYAFLNPTQSNLPIKSGEVQLSKDTSILFANGKDKNNTATTETQKLPEEEVLSAIKNSINK